MDNRPIGVFDSGLGGLTVVRQLMHDLPHEQIVYLGDTARVPYGSRSPEIVRKFARQDAYFLAGRNVKYIVIACNTASAQAEPDLVQRLAIPVMGVIEPGADAAVAATRNGSIGVIGTLGTIASGAYQRAITARRPQTQIVAQACPLFVPLAEEGAQESEAASLIARDYLLPLLERAVDSLILGCTHYPILASVIAKTVGLDVQLIDPGIALAQALAGDLAARGLRAEGDRPAPHQYYVTDRSVHFQELAERFLGSSLCATVEQVELD
ncbi:MAG TPA: glutamate racemase [Chloroflexota bacterium]|nr:glutamate racemase [Chloroflexota bacterium]